MTDTVRRVLAGVIAGLFVAGVMAAAFEDTLLATGDRASRPAPPEAKDFDTAVGDIRTVVPALQRFVERERGLRFKTEVNVTLLDDASFRARLAEGNGVASEDELEELAETGRVLRALGLLDRDVDLDDARNDLLGEAVAGFYDPETEELVVRGARATALVRRVLVHELTHALQDQHFELHRPDLDERDDEVSIAFTSLVEGDAVRVEKAFEDQLSDEDREAADEEESRQTAGLLDRDIPPVLIQFLGFPYAAGEPFVREVLRQGGQARLDAAFAAPPTTTEHILHPDTFLAGEEGAPVTPPRAEGEVFDRGVLGEYGLFVVLSRALPNGRAAEAARGWRGDWYVAWDERSDTCVRATIVTDTGRDRSELRSALERWADSRDRVVLREDGDRTTFTACG